MANSPPQYPFGKSPVNLLDKATSHDSYVQYMFQRTKTMFSYYNLPETIPPYMLEMYLQINGSCCITKVNGELYALIGGLGGPPDPYYRPTLYVVANPALKYSATLTIGTDCTLCRNDSMLQGLWPLFSRYASQLVENDISIRCTQINARMQAVISAATGNDLEAANKYMEDLEKGKLAAIGEKPFLDGIKVQSALNASSNNIMQLLELQQYLKASWYNDIGLNANFNMKREALNEAETKMNNDSLLPLVDDMLDCRLKFVKDVNEMYGTDIRVEKSGAWRIKSIEIMQDIVGVPTDTPESLPESEDVADANDENAPQLSEDVKTEDQTGEQIPVDGKAQIEEEVDKLEEKSL